MAETDLSPFNFVTDVRVRLPETDTMGVVFHGFFFTYFEVGRVDYLRNLNLLGDKRPINDFDNVVVSCHLDCKFPARLDDPINIHVRVSHIKNSSFTFEFALIHSEEKRLIATGHTIHCATDNNFSPIKVPDSFRDTIKAFEENLK